jgi:hypothetical protein
MIQKTIYEKITYMSKLSIIYLLQIVNIIRKNNNAARFIALEPVIDYQINYIAIPLIDMVSPQRLSKVANSLSEHNKFNLL